eukprot:14558424-Alexandrium_andersonii.AAC.1
MATSCRAEEVFGWGEALRHLLRGARAGLSRQPPGYSRSDSEDEDAVPRTDAGQTLTRPAWSTTRSWPCRTCSARADVR